MCPALPLLFQPGMKKEKHVKTIFSLGTITIEYLLPLPHLFPFLSISKEIADVRWSHEGLTVYIVEGLVEWLNYHRIGIKIPEVHSLRSNNVMKRELWLYVQEGKD